MLRFMRHLTRASTYHLQDHREHHAHHNTEHAHHNAAPLSHDNSGACFLSLHGDRTAFVLVRASRDWVAHNHPHSPTVTNFQHLARSMNPTTPKLPTLLSLPPQLRKTQIGFNHVCLSCPKNTYRDSSIEEIPAT